MVLFKVSIEELQYLGYRSLQNTISKVLNDFEVKETLIVMFKENS